MFALMTAIQRVGCILNPATDLVVATTSMESRTALLDAAGETWRKGLRTFVYTDSLAMADKLRKENKFPDMTYDWYPAGERVCRARFHSHAELQCRRRCHAWHAWGGGMHGE